MQAVEFDIKIFKGDPFIRELSFVNNGSPVNINGWIFYFTVKNEKHLDLTEDKDAVFKKDIVAENASSGKVNIYLTGAETLTFPVSSFKYDIKVKKGTNDPETIIFGNLIVLPSVTKRGITT